MLGLFRLLLEALKRNAVFPQIDPTALLDRFADYRAPRVRKWLGPEET